MDSELLLSAEADEISHHLIEAEQIEGAQALINQSLKILFLNAMIAHLDPFQPRAAQNQDVLPAYLPGILEFFD